MIQFLIIRYHIQYESIPLLQQVDGSGESGSGNAETDVHTSR